MDHDEIRERVEEYEKLNYRFDGELNGVGISFAVVNNMSLYRVNTLLTKEPETIEWMLALKPNDILFDVGANIGLFTVVAARVSGATVYAFEPESQNYALLHKNIFLNGIHERVSAFCAAVTDKFGMEKLYLSNFSIAGSCHQFGHQVDYNLAPVSGMFGQGCVGIGLDAAVAAGMLPVPTHIKIDVDGFEHKVLAGAKKILRDRKLKSLIIEVNFHIPQHVGMLRDLEKAGFTYSRAQMEESNIGRRVDDPRFNKFYNIIFTRA